MRRRATTSNFGLYVIAAFVVLILFCLAMGLSKG